MRDRFEIGAMNDAVREQENTIRLLWLWNYIMMFWHMPASDAVDGFHPKVSRG